MLFHLFLFFLTLGPPIPLPGGKEYIYDHTMIEMQGDVFVFGGIGSGQASIGVDAKTIYKLSCSSGICSWSTLSQALKFGKSLIVAIPVPDSFCT
jgi:hypothetical protein